MEKQVKETGKAFQIPSHDDLKIEIEKALLVKNFVFLVFLLIICLPRIRGMLVCV